MGMDSNDHRELLNEIAELRREVRSTRRWVICGVILVAIPVVPLVLGLLSGLGEVGNMLKHLLGLAAFFLFAAFVVSQLFSRSSAKPE